MAPDLVLDLGQGKFNLTEKMAGNESLDAGVLGQAAEL